MIDFWNNRYGADEYAYGTIPNEFLKEQLVGLNPGHILFPAEGEGRNAVYAAKQGWQASAFDMSEAGKEKALRLAQSQDVAIKYDIANLMEFDFGVEKYDAISFVYVHMDPETRSLIHLKATAALKVGGRIILEAFSKNQLGKDSGGPKNIDWLFSQEQLALDFKSLSIEILEETTTQLTEGPFHHGEAEVVRLVAIKK